MTSSGWPPLGVLLLIVLAAGCAAEPPGDPDPGGHRAKALRADPVFMDPLPPGFQANNLPNVGIWKAHGQRCWEGLDVTRQLSAVQLGEAEATKAFSAYASAAGWIYVGVVGPTNPTRVWHKKLQGRYPASLFLFKGAAGSWGEDGRMSPAVKGDGAQCRGGPEFPQL
jgi:hypothetical protein